MDGSEAAARVWRSLTVPDNTSEAERSDDSLRSDRNMFMYRVGGLEHHAGVPSTEATSERGRALGSDQTTIDASPQQVFVAVRRSAPGRQVFTSLAKREGVVSDVMSDEFVATLTNLLDQDTDASGDLEATFALDEVSPADRPLVAPGAVFYWNIGYYDDPSGQRRRVSELSFRRMPRWQPKQLAAAAQKADDILRNLGIV